MTSNSDDLEEALQQNLKLRRRLGAEVAKAAQNTGQKRPQLHTIGRLNSPPLKHARELDRVPCSGC